MASRSIVSRLIFFLMCLALTACSSYSGKLQEPRSLFREGRFQEAAALLTPLAEETGDDQLLYLLDLAMVYQASGDFEQSSRALLKADQLADLNDYHSITRFTGSILGGRESLQYKGESYEKFLINTMLAINFAAQGNLDSALVEARKINNKISAMKMEGREPYELSPFATYFSALLWEAERKWDDAYIAFEATHKLSAANNPFLAEDLIRSALRARRTDAAKQWQKAFPQIKEDPLWKDKKSAEIIILALVGWGPVKQMRENYRIPTLVRSSSVTSSARLVWNNGGKENVLKTLEVYDIAGTAIDTFERDYASLVAGRFGAMVAKAVVADQIRQKNEALGMVAWIVMNVADRADLRGWSTLPRGVQMLRIRVPAGEHQFTLKGVSFEGSDTGEQKEFTQVQVEPGETKFIFWRPLR